jgi:hypothetical protein
MNRSACVPFNLMSPVSGDYFTNGRRKDRGRAFKLQNWLPAILHRIQASANCEM